MIAGVIAMAAGCGGEEPQQFDVDRVEPGGECEYGGVVVDLDGDDHYICDGADGQDGATAEIDVEDVGADDADNPCDTDAVKVTVEPAGGGEETVEYVCDGDSPNISTQRVDADHADNPCGTDALEVVIEPADGGDPAVEYVCDGKAPQVDVTIADDECGEAGGVILEVSGDDGESTTEAICNGEDGEDGSDIEVEPATDDECEEGGIRVRTEGDDGQFGPWMAVCNGIDGQDGEDGQDGQDGQDGEDGQDGADGEDGVGTEVILEETTPSHPSSDCDYRGVLMTIIDPDGSGQSLHFCEALPTGTEVVAYFSFAAGDFDDTEDPHGFLPTEGDSAFFTHTAFTTDPRGVYLGQDSIGQRDYAKFGDWQVGNVQEDSPTAFVQIDLDGYSEPTIDFSHGLNDDGPGIYGAFFYDDINVDDGTVIANPDIDRQDEFDTEVATYEGSIDGTTTSAFAITGYDSEATVNEWAFSDVFIYAYPVD